MSRLPVLLIAFATLLGPCPAQDPTVRPSTGRRLLDGVVAIIGDRVILRSTLNREVEARAAGREITPDERMSLQSQVVTEIAREEIWIEHGKSIGDKAPEAFEDAISREIDARLREEIRASGSFSQLDAEIGLLGDSWTDIRRRQRNEILESIGLNNIMSPLFVHRSLMVTPREIREFFDSHPERFSQADSTDIAWVGFEIGRDEAAARERVLAAAAAWSAEDLSAQQVADRFDGSALPVQLAVRPTESDDRAEVFKRFATEHSVGEVSEPIRRGAGLFVLLRVLAKTEASRMDFSDPAVQSHIRDLLARERATAGQNQVLARKRTNIYTWPPSLNLER